jgi:hypothetical protein
MAQKNNEYGYNVVIEPGVLDSNDSNDPNSITYYNLTKYSNPDANSIGAAGNQNTKTDYWLFYNGVVLKIYTGPLGDYQKSKLHTELKATSGSKYYQNSQFQHKKSNNDKEPGGPVPEGKYKVNLIKDPRGLTKHNKQFLLTQLPSGVEQLHMIKKNGDVAWWPNWGRLRARLEPLAINNPNKRSNFYIHDSYKGESHGCIETETYIYYLFLYLHDFSKSDIKLIVKYPSANASTYGGTDTIDMRVPTNINKTYMGIDKYYLETPTPKYQLVL